MSCKNIENLKTTSFRENWKNEIKGGTALTELLNKYQIARSTAYKIIHKEAVENGFVDSGDFIRFLSNSDNSDFRESTETSDFQKSDESLEPAPVEKTREIFSEHKKCFRKNFFQLKSEGLTIREMAERSNLSIDLCYFELRKMAKEAAQKDSPENWEENWRTIYNTYLIVPNRSHWGTSHNCNNSELANSFAKTEKTIAELDNSFNELINELDEISKNIDLLLQKNTLSD